MPYTKDQQKRLNELGARVRAIREGKNISQTQLAHSIGKDPQSIYRLEVGGINPSYLYLQQICEGLNISLSELVERN
jgi:transcriptional regulator with XRE-family HTH domain